MDLELKDIDSYYGTTNYYDIFGIQVTDGVMYLMNNGYSWFVTDAIAVILANPKVRAYLKDNNFLAVKLLLHNNYRAELVIEDGNGVELHTQHYSYTDAKRSLTLYYCDNILMLNTEY